MLVICKKPRQYLSLLFAVFLGYSDRGMAGAVEATQLEYVSVGSADCTRIYLRSSRHFKGTIFQLPKVIPGTLANDDQFLYEIQEVQGAPGNSSSDSREYNLNIRFSFPSKEGSVLGRNRASSRTQDTENCDADTVLSAINRDAKTRDQLITKISPLPLIGIEVAIPGIVAKPSIIGSNGSAMSQDVSILDYHGKTMTVIFRISSAERKMFEQKLRTEQGVPAEVRFHFLARSHNGSVHATVDVNSLIEDVKAQFSGKKSITKAEFKAYLEQTQLTQFIRVTAEDGTSDTSKKIAENIIDLLQKELSLGAMKSKNTDVSGGSDHDTSAPLSNGGRGFWSPPTTGNDPVVPPWISPPPVNGGNSPSQPSPTVPQPQQPSPKVEQEKGPYLSLRTIIEVMSQQIKRDFLYEQISGPEKAVAQTEVVLRTSRLNDPNVQRIKISSGYNPPSTGIRLDENSTVVISFQSIQREKIEYVEEKTYLTQSEIQKAHLEKYFPDILNKSFTITNREVNGITFAVAESTCRFCAPFLKTKYRWFKVSRYPRRVQIDESENNLSGRNDSGGNIFQDLSNMGLGVSFSSGRGGEFINFSRLLAPGSKLWDSYIDPEDSRLVVTAKKNLGSMILTEKMTDPLYIKTQPVILEEYYQEEFRDVNPTSLFNKSQVVRGYVADKDDKAIVLQTSVLFKVTIPGPEDLPSSSVGNSGNGAVSNVGGMGPGPSRP